MLPLKTEKKNSAMLVLWTRRYNGKDMRSNVTDKRDEKYWCLTSLRGWRHSEHGTYMGDAFVLQCAYTWWGWWWHKLCNGNVGLIAKTRLLKTYKSPRYNAFFFMPLAHYCARGMNNVTQRALLVKTYGPIGLRCASITDCPFPSGSAGRDQAHRALLAFLNATASASR